MAQCVICGGPYSQVVRVGDTTFTVCDACLPEMQRMLAEPVQLPGRNDPCPECLEKGIHIKLKKCKEHNDESAQQPVEGNASERPSSDQWDIKPQESAASESTTPVDEGNK